MSSLERLFEMMSLSSIEYCCDRRAVPETGLAGAVAPLVDPLDPSAGEASPGSVGGASVEGERVDGDAEEGC